MITRESACCRRPKTLQTLANARAPSSSLCRATSATCAEDHDRASAENLHQLGGTKPSQNNARCGGGLSWSASHLESRGKGGAGLENTHQESRGGHSSLPIAHPRQKGWTAWLTVGSLFRRRPLRRCFPCTSRGQQMFARQNTWRKTRIREKHILT